MNTNDAASSPIPKLWLWALLWLLGWSSGAGPATLQAQSAPCTLLPDTLVIASGDCNSGLAVCLPFPLNSSGQYAINVDGQPYLGTRTGCDFDTANVYFLGLVINGGVGPYELRWTVNGAQLTAVVMSFQAVADSMNAFDPLGGWVYDPLSMTIAGGAPGHIYSAIRLEFLPINSPANIGFNQVVTARGTQLRIPASTQQLIVSDLAASCSDTATIQAFCTTTDTLDLRLSMGDAATLCLDTTELMGVVQSVAFGCLPDTTITTLSPLSPAFCLTANAVYTGQTALCVTLCDDTGLCDTTVIRLTVTPRVDTLVVTFPILDTSTYCLPTDQLPGLPVTLSDLGCTPPALGTYQLGDSCIRYAAGSIAGQGDTLCLVLTDALGWSDTTVLIVHVTDSVNLAPPVAIDDIHAAFAGRRITGNVLTNDRSPDGDGLVVTHLLNAPSSGSLTLLPDGRYQYASPNAPTPVAVQYVVCDVQTPSWCDTATLRIEVIAPLQPQPVAMGDHGRVPLGDTTRLLLTANDLLLTDTAQRAALTVALIQPPAFGTASLSGDTLVYAAPSSTLATRDTLRYAVCLGSQCDTGWVTLHIEAPRPGRAAPVGVDDAWVTQVGVPLTGHVLANDWDSDLDGLSANRGAVLPSRGTFTLLPDGSFQYLPDASFVGTVHFTYQVCDNAPSPQCDSATAYILITDRIVTTLDTVRATLEVGTDTTLCMNHLLGDVFVLQSLGCAPLLGNWVATNDSCFTYTAGSLPGVQDTLCLTLTDAYGNVDTTIYVFSSILTPFSLPTDTVQVILPIATTDTFCVSTSGLVGNLLNSQITTCSATSLGTLSVLSDTCFAYSTPVVGSDTICVVINDEFGVTDTTVYVIQSIDIRPDTLYLTLNNGIDTVVCLDAVIDFETPILTIQDLGCSPLDQTLVAILGTTGCLRLVTNATAGRDTLCIVACDALGFCDTTYLIVQVAANADTLFQTVNTGDTLRHCFPNNELTDAILTTSVAQLPLLATNYAATYDAVTGDVCVTYIAGLHPGMDTAVVVLCDVTGICDTTTIIYLVEPTCDNFAPLAQGAVLYTEDCAGQETLCLEPLAWANASQYDIKVDGVPARLSACNNGRIGISLDVGWHTVLLSDTVNGCADTALVRVLCAAVDTVLVSVASLDSVVLCHPMGNLSLLPDGLNAIDTAYFSCGGTGSVAAALPLGCWLYQAPATPGVDTVCWTVCDVLGHCETVVYILQTVVLPDTIMLALTVGSDTTLCLSTAGSGVDATDLFDVYVGCDTLDIALLGISALDTCITISAVQVGVDTTCLVVCDGGGNCDTTYLVVSVVEELDTTAFAARPDTVTVCSTAVFNVLTNDLGYEAPDTVLLLTLPARGIARIGADTVIGYEVVDEHAVPFVDAFEYVVCAEGQCDTATVRIETICDPSVVVYNGLSPNGDFFNDVWVIEELPNYPNRVQVFNRWGNRVFVKENYQNDWGGTWRTDDLPDGTYFYLVEYERNGEWIQLSGYLQLHR